MQIAELYAQESRATRAKVGAVLVTSTGVLIPGYNGTPSGWDNICEVDNKTLPYVLHAEMNCILKCAEEGVSTRGCTIYVTHSPCWHCAACLAQCGVKTVRYKQKYGDAVKSDYNFHMQDIKCQQIIDGYTTGE